MMRPTLVSTAAALTLRGPLHDHLSTACVTVRLGPRWQRYLVTTLSLLCSSPLLYCRCNLRWAYTPLP